jgi:23S rRNA G2445 N2-methylase RlmL
MAPAWQLVARTLRGLEWIAAAEIAGVPGLRVRETAHREVHFECDVLTRAAGELRCADDVFLVCGRLEGVDHRRESLAALAAQTARLDVAAAVSARLDVRAAGSARAGGGTAAPAAASFDVVASFLSRRNYNRFEIEAALEPVLARALGIPRRSEPTAPADLALRVHLSGGGGWLGLRLADAPLHRRPWKQDSRPATLHPPAAAALALLVALRPGQRVLDPCCGAGTLAIEAALAEPRARVVGCDLAGEALAAARGNAARARAPISWLCADAGRLPIAARALDRVLANPPWGGGAEPQGSLARGGAAALAAELARVLARGGRAALLAEPEASFSRAATAAGLHVVHAQPLHVFGRRPHLHVVAVDADAPRFDPRDPRSAALAEAHRRFGPLEADAASVG